MLLHELISFFADCVSEKGGLSNNKNLALSSINICMNYIMKVTVNTTRKGCNICGVRDLKHHKLKE